MKIFGVFDADWYLSLPVLTAWFWATGGSGALVFRRFGVPAAIGLYAIGYGISFWPLVIFLIHAVLIFSLGYGDDAKKKLGSLFWFYAYLVGFLYGFSQFGLCLYFGDWLPLFISSCASGVIFSGTLYCSQRFDFPRHKLQEIITGIMVGLTAALIIS